MQGSKPFVHRLAGTGASAWVLAVCLSTAPAALAQGVGDLTVSPTRVVFEDRSRSAQLTLVHRGSQPATYRISFIQMAMSEDGQLSEVAEPAGGRMADRLVRFSPRQVTLEPGLAQTVRLLLRRPADLARGEYRSHLLLRAVPAADAGTSIETLELEDQAIAVELTPIYGVSVPVIVRHGELQASAEISDFAFEPATGEGSQPAVSLRLLRRGARSLYGDLELAFSPHDGRGELVVGLFKGLAVYTPNGSRLLRLPLALPDGSRLENGRLRVVFSESERDDAAVARAEIPLS